MVAVDVVVAVDPVVAVDVVVAVDPVVAVDVVVAADPVVAVDLVSDASDGLSRCSEAREHWGAVCCRRLGPMWLPGYRTRLSPPDRQLSLGVGDRRE